MVHVILSYPPWGQPVFIYEISQIAKIKFLARFSHTMVHCRNVYISLVRASTEFHGLEAFRICRGQSTREDTSEYENWVITYIHVRYHICCHMILFPCQQLLTDTATDKQTCLVQFFAEGAECHTPTLLRVRARVSMTINSVLTYHMLQVSMTIKLLVQCWQNSWLVGDELWDDITTVQQQH